MSDKPCGHPEHPEDGNVGAVDPEKGPITTRHRDVFRHRHNPVFFVGMCVKLKFPAGAKNEYMWVAVTGRTKEPNGLRGILLNTPVLATDVKWGAIVEFTTREILDVTE